MPRWNSPKRGRSSSSGSPEVDRYETKKRFVSRSRSRERKRTQLQYNRSPSPRYRSDNRSKYDQPRKSSPITKKKHPNQQNQRNRSYSPENHYKDPPKNKRRSPDGGYRGGSFSPDPKRKRSVTPTKRRYDRDEQLDGKTRRKQNVSPDRYDKRSGGKNIKDGDDHYKQPQSKRSRSGGKGYKRGSRSASDSPPPPRRSGSRKKDYNNQKYASQSKYDNSSSNRKHHDIDPSEIRININTAKPSPPPRNIFNVEELVIPRRKDEGTKPLFDRPELRQRSYYDTQDNNLDEERRVVSVKKSNDNIEYMQSMPVQERNLKQPQQQHQQHPMQQQASLDQFQRNPTMFQYSSLSNHDLGISGSKMNQNIYQQPQQNTYSQIELQPHNVMQSSLPTGRNDPPMYDLPTGDLRHCLKSRRSPKPQNDHKKSSRDRDYNQRSRSKSQQRSRKMKASTGDNNVNDRLLKLSSNDDQSHDKLPNFRKELEEIQRDEWKLNPTNIPRSEQYFLHDDRERRESIEDKAPALKSKTEFSKFRKRGGTTTAFRGYGRSSGFSTGRGFASRRGFVHRGTGRGATFYGRGGKRSPPSWKHDMYDSKKGNKTSKSTDKFSSKRSSNLSSRKEPSKRPSSSSRK